VTTGDPAEFVRLGSRVLRRRIESAEHISLDALRELPDARLLDMLEATREGEA
jgi:hypothetical protein